MLRSLAGAIGFGCMLRRTEAGEAFVLCCLGFFCSRPLRFWPFAIVTLHRLPGGRRLVLPAYFVRCRHRERLFARDTRSRCNYKSTGAAVLCRRPDNTWPEQPELIGVDGELRVESIGFAAPLSVAYRISGLV